MLSYSSDDLLSIVMVEAILPGFISRDLDQAAHDYYRQPFLEKSSRKQITQWPNEMPIGRAISDWYRRLD